MEGTLVFREIPRYTTTDNYVGMLLITYGDNDNLKTMLPTFEATVDYPTYLHIINYYTENDCYDLLRDWAENQQNKYIYSIGINQLYNLESLAKSLNRGFRFLMSRQECELIGWCHPDALYEPEWLSNLVSVLNTAPTIGKVCSYNTRDSLPVSDYLIPGHEQIYLIRRGVLYKAGLFDEQFIDIGGWEDIDHDRRVIQEGWGVVISPTSKVNHFGMGTRSKRDTSQAQKHNAQVYHNKWGDMAHGEIYK